jgi:hypothetical protein
MADSPFSGFLGQLGIRDMPWVIRVYLTLFIVFAFALIYAAIHAPSNVSRDVVEALPITKLFNIAADGMKTVLGALLGSLSLAATGKFKGNKTN